MQQLAYGTPLAGRVALVTGAASGIGRASALALARAGARVMVSDIDEAGGRETLDQIERSGGEGAFRAADVADGSQMAALVKEALETFGRLDCA